MGNSNPLGVEESAFLVSIQQKIRKLENRVEELEEEKADNFKEDLYSILERSVDIVSVHMTVGHIEFHLSDDRTVILPIDWSWKLQKADPSSRENHKITDGGNRVVWPDVGEEISVTGVLLGEPAPRPEEE